MTRLAPLVPAAASPFKFLDAYGQDDRAVFFGRDEEIETFYRLLGESRLVLVYGQSGTGKTSLIQCGLTSKFSPTNWLPVFVRRADDLNNALLQALNALAITPLAQNATVPQAVRSVYLDHLRPVFLIFDQFEELYVLGTKAEQDQFYETIQALLGTDVSCRIIVSLREEYLALLDPFERAVPSLFDKRLRVETMTHSNIEKVILGTTAAHGIGLEHGADTARKIIAQLDEKHVGIALAYLQVYLDHLWRGAIAAGASDPVTFTDAQVEEAGQLGDIMAGFLDEQEAALQAQLEAGGSGIAKGGVARLLDEFVTLSGTKQPSTAAEITARLPSSAPWLQAALTALQSRRLLRLVGDHYEIAHDALAARIAERRSRERKDLLEIKKIIADRREGVSRNNTYLTSDELTMVKRAAAQKDPMTGDALFVLNDDDLAFVAASRKAARRAWLRGSMKVIGTAVATVVALIALVFWLPDPEEFDQPEPKSAEEINKDFNQVDRYTTVMLSSLLDRGSNGQDALDLLGQISGIYSQYEDYDSFVKALRNLDESALKPGATGIRTLYEPMAQEYEALLAEAGATPADRIKAKTVRWHQYWLGELDNREATAAPLIKLMQEFTPQQLGGAVYAEDIDLVCKDLAFEKKWVEGCPALPPVDGQSGTGALGSGAPAPGAPAGAGKTAIAAPRPGTAGPNDGNQLIDQGVNEEVVDTEPAG